MFKMMKQQSKFFIYFKQIFKITPQVERISYFLLSTFIIVHVIACIWYIIAKFNDFGPNT